MKKGILFLLMMLALFVGCATDNDMVETNAEFEPYWWRDDPFYADKDIDEEATNALGDPNVVIGENKPRPPREIMFGKIAEQIGAAYNIDHQEQTSQIGHFLLHDTETVRAMDIPSIDWKLFDAEMQKIKQHVPAFEPHDLCDCPMLAISGEECLEENASQLKN